MTSTSSAASAGAGDTNKPAAAAAPVSRTKALSSKLLKHINSDSYAYQLLTSVSSEKKYPLRIYQLSWQAHLKELDHNITECCMFVDDIRLPTICNASVTDIGTTQSQSQSQSRVDSRRATTERNRLKVSQIKVNSLSLDINNNKKVTPVNLSQYLRAFCARNELSTQALSISQNESIFYNLQASLVPKLDMNEATEFNLAAYNAHSHVKKPAALVIVSTVHGTSAVVVEGNFQKLYFDNLGKRSNFVVNSNKAEYCTIIQIPLRTPDYKLRSKRPPPPQQQSGTTTTATADLASSWGLSSYIPYWGSSTPTNTTAGANRLRGSGGLHNPITSANVVKVVPKLHPTCKCSLALIKLVAKFCYGTNNEQVTISCDGCAVAYSGEAVIWHCPQHKSTVHPNGYDLCDNCAQLQLNFNELRHIDARTVQRDLASPVRVTFQYAFPTPTEIMTPSVVENMVKMMQLKEQQLRRLSQMHSSFADDTAQQSNSGHGHGSHNKSNNNSNRMSIGNGFVRASANAGQPRNISPQIQQRAFRAQVPAAQSRNPTPYSVRISPDGKLIRERANVNVNANANVDRTRGRLLHYMQDEKEERKQISPPNSVVRDRDPRGSTSNGNTELITAALQGLHIEEWQSIVLNFERENVSDSDLTYIDCSAESQDLLVLFPTLGPRLRFRSWLKKYQSKFNAINQLDDHGDADANANAIDCANDTRDNTQDHQAPDLYGTTTNAGNSAGNASNNKSASTVEISPKHEILVNAMNALNIDSELILKYISNFEENVIFDDMLPILLSVVPEDVFARLIPEIGPRMLFRGWLSGSILCTQYPNPFLNNNNNHAQQQQ